MTLLQGVAQPGSAPVLGTGSHRFKSCHPENPRAMTYSRVVSGADQRTAH